MSERRFDERQQTLHVITRGEFRHDTAINSMQFNLREQLVRQQTLAAVEHGGGRFVAGRFDGEDAHMP